MKWNASDPARDNAARRLPRMAREFFTAGDAAARSTATPQEMHNFRLRTKRFRYTLEIFKPCYGDEIDLRLEPLRELQQHLGEINDSAVSRELLLGRTDLTSKQQQNIRRGLDTNAATAADAFRTFWAEAFGPARRREWLRYLAAAGAVKSAQTSRPPHEST